MSKLYTVEPPTSAKVSLKTTVGDIDIELWTKECPKTCQNFMQLCTEGYYDNTIFHRVIKGFVVHGGDPNGDGSGGQSIYGEPFEDEFHRRLRYTRRGLVGMLNFGKNDNGSQFFFTLAATPDLQNKNTLFGKVTDDTIFNMLRLEVGALDQNKRPINLQKIIRTEVISNPFDEILPNVSREEVENKQMTIKHEKRVENFSLLSFDDQTDEDEENIKTLQENSAKKLKIMHDMVDDPRLSEQTIKIENLSDHKLVSADEEFGEDEKDITVEYNNIKMEDTDSDDVLLTQEEENKSDDINRRTAKKTNKMQLQILLQLMECNPDIARGFHKGSKEDVARFWGNATTKLNSAGPPIKSMSEWKKVWVDQKKYVKKKAVDNFKIREGTGGGSNIEHTFSAVEEAIYNLIGLKDGVESLPVKKIGLHLTEVPTILPPQCSTTEATETKGEQFESREGPFSEGLVKTTASNRDIVTNTLKEELGIQREICDTIKIVMKHCKENSQNTKKIYRSIEKLHDIQSKHFQKMETLKQQELEEQKRHNLYMEELKLRKIVNEIAKNRRLLEIEELKLQNINNSN